jgi:hypothetical protein
MIGGDRMEGVLFYWFAWMGWIWTTFLLNKNNENRVRFSIWLLVLIIFSPYRMTIMGIEVYLAAFILLSLFVVSTAYLTSRVFLSVFISVFIVMLGYVSFLLFELFDPVWVLFDRKWMIAVGGVLLSSVLQSTIRLRVISLVTGMLLGDFLFAVLLKKLSFSYLVAAPAFMDILSIIIMLIVIWTGLSYFAQASNNYIYQGRGKQKSS